MLFLLLLPLPLLLLLLSSPPPPPSPPLLLLLWAVGWGLGLGLGTVVIFRRVHFPLPAHVPPRYSAAQREHRWYSSVTVAPRPVDFGGTWSRCALHSDISINFKAALPTHHCMSGIAQACSALLCCDIQGTCTPRYTHARRPATTQTSAAPLPYCPRRPVSHSVPRLRPSTLPLDPTEPAASSQQPAASITGTVDTNGRPQWKTRVRWTTACRQWLTPIAPGPSEGPEEPYVLLRPRPLSRHTAYN